MEDYYTNKSSFLLTIKVLEDQIDDLGRFSVWNDDIGSDEIREITLNIGILKAKVEALEGSEE